MDSNDFDLASVIRLAWKRKWSWMIIHSVIVTLTFCYLILWATPFYTSSIVISPKEAEGPSSADLLSKLGGLGSMVGATLGVGGSTNMDKTVLLMESGDFISSYIEKYDLLPAIFYKDWDSTASKWTIEEKRLQPSTLKGVTKFKDDILVIIKDATAGAITISMTIQGEGQSKIWVDRFLKDVNFYLKSNVIEKSKRNQKFLKSRLGRTQNPMILSKIQVLLAYEIEKEMLADDLSFDIIDSSVVPLKPSKPNKILMLILAIFMSNFIWIVYALTKPLYLYFKNLLDEPDERTT